MSEPYFPTSFGCTLVAIVSRRAAGVWTHLPSTTIALLDCVPPPCSIVWIDFGLRYEMFNHFRIGAQTFPQDKSMLALINRCPVGPSQALDLLTYAEAVCVGGDTGHPTLSAMAGLDQTAYRRIVKQHAEAGRVIYMIPWHTPQMERSIEFAKEDVARLAAVVRKIVSVTSARYVFMTWEGQPEGQLFSQKLQEDIMLQWGLQRADRILSLVRFDTQERFADSVSIPSLLQEDPALAAKLRIVLTRVLRPPRSDSIAMRKVIGQLPFAECVGQSVNAGRIPLLEFACVSEGRAFSTGEKRYIEAVTSLAKAIEEDRVS